MNVRKRDSPRGVTFAFSANGMTPTQQLQVSVLLLLVSKCRNNQKEIIKIKL
jgi:hypothetical protein